jgi:hypothetical protein
MIISTNRIFSYQILIFVILGTVLYLSYSRVTTYIDRKDNRISVSAAQVELLKTSFEKTWNRPPTEKELRAQIDNFIMDEIFFKEAVAMGLDKKDPAVKRRMRQIIEMMLDDYATVYPAESQLQQYLSENSEDFRLPSRISFEHVYFKLEEKEQAISQLNRLNSGEFLNMEGMGELLLIPPRFEDETQYEIERLFGKPFTTALFDLDTGIWKGPVESAYGWHLVLVTERIDGEIPDLSKVRDQVEREWMVEKRKEMKNKQYELMRSRYSITVERHE